MKELGITKESFKPPKLFRTDNGNGQMAICDENIRAVAFVPKLHPESEQWMDLIESIPELLERYNEAIEVLKEVHKDGDNYLPRTIRIKVEQTISKANRE